jgi:hypothetical protein
MWRRRREPNAEPRHHPAAKGDGLAGAWADANAGCVFLGDTAAKPDGNPGPDPVAEPDSSSDADQRGEQLGHPD